MIFVTPLKACCVDVICIKMSAQARSSSTIRFKPLICPSMRLRRVSKALRRSGQIIGSCNGLLFEVLFCSSNMMSLPPRDGADSYPLVICSRSHIGVGGICIVSMEVDNGQGANVPYECFGGGGSYILCFIPC